MQQSKIASLTETVVNTVIGFVLAVCAQIAIFPLFGIHEPIHTHLQMVTMFTLISLVRGYFVRRLFNYAPWRKYKESTDE